MRMKDLFFLLFMLVAVVFGLFAFPVSAGGKMQCGMSRMAAGQKSEAHPETMQRLMKIMSAAIYLDSPAVIYGQAETLGLSVEQKAELKKIENESRQKALRVLTAKQREKLGEIPAEAMTVAQLSGNKMPHDTAKGSAVGCSMKGVAKSAGEVKQAAEQRTCPLMGGAINKSIFAEYKGKKVYFCCAGCKPRFEAEPEKYLAKLPQFN